MNKILCCVTLLLTAFPSLANDQAIVAAALENIATDFDETWAYTETTVEDGVEYAARFDPSFPLGSQWILLTVDGRAPTVDETNAFDVDKNADSSHQDEENEDGSDGMAFDLIKMDTLTLLEETDAHWMYGFVPTAGDDDDKDAEEFMKKVTGKLKVIRNGHYPEYIRLENDKPIRPAFGVKITKFLTLLRFGPATDDGPVVPLSIDVMLQGRAMLAVKISESETIRFSDYEHVGQNLPSD